MVHPERVVLTFRRLLLIFLVAFFCDRLDAQSRIVELTVFAGPGSQAGAQQEWLQLLADVGADRVSSVFRADARPSIDEEKFGGSTIVSVKGVLKNGRLLLPGKKFTRSDSARIKQYLRSLRDDKAEVAFAEKKAFGLTAEQLREVHEMLSPEVASSTVGITAADAIQSLLGDARLPVRMDTDVKARLAKGKTLLDERKGLTVGTALASILNECGAGLVPRRPPGGAIELHIVGVDAAAEVWPIGWPSEQAPVALEPRLFQRQDIRIERFPLSDALTAVAKRCGAQVLYNRAALVDRGIDLAQTEVSFARKQVTYMVTFGKLLRQSDPPMDIEVRVDEAGNPFAWIDVRE